MLFDWPADTTVPFEEMSVCDCGSLDSGKTPDLLVENNLRYWHATFFPYGLQFTNLVQPDGTCPADPGCGAPSVAVCITALTPIPRFEPDPTSEFPLYGDGQPATFTPLSQPRLGFDRDAEMPDLAEPYTYDIEHFTLNNWLDASQPTQDEVENCIPTCKPYGHYLTSGDLSMPYFGLTPSGIQVMTLDVGGQFHNPVNLFEEGNPSQLVGCRLPRHRRRHRPDLVQGRLLHAQRHRRRTTAPTLPAAAAARSSPSPTRCTRISARSTWPAA